MSFLKEYTLLGELGTGGFAKVYKVRHNELGYIRAIRVLNEPITDENSRTYQKFLRECKVLLRLGNGSQSNIVHIYQPRLLENHALVEMDYVDGKDIAHYLQDNDNFLPVEEVLRMAKEMSGALAYCHEDIYKFCMDPDEDRLDSDPIDGTKFLINDATKQRLIDKYKVIHNDIHSGNIMRREDGSFVLLDFGLALTGDDDVRNSSRHENGAVEYKSPEKWDDDTALTEQSDVYSFGIVMYEYLAGRVPFPYDKTNSNRIKAAYMLGEAHKNQTPPLIFELRKAYYEAKNTVKMYEKDYPEWLEEAIMKCLEKDPSRRFKSGKELYEFICKHDDGQNTTLLSENQSLTEEKHLLEQEKKNAEERISRLTRENQSLQDSLDAITAEKLKLESQNIERLKMEGQNIAQQPLVEPTPQKKKTSIIPWTITVAACLALVAMWLFGKGGDESVGNSGMMNALNNNIQRTNEVLSKQVESKYADFDLQYALDNEKVGPYWKQAVELRNGANEVVDYIGSLKVEAQELRRGFQEDSNFMLGVDEANTLSEKLQAFQKEVEKIIWTEYSQAIGCDLDDCFRNMVNTSCFTILNELVTEVRTVELMAVSNLLSDVHPSDYTSAVSVSATKMNVVYRGIYNPISIDGGGSGEITVTANSGTLNKTGNGTYTLRPGDASEVTVSVSSNGSSLGSMKFRVKDLPKPTALIRNVRNGLVSKSALLAANRVEAEMKDFDFDGAHYDVVGYTFRYKTKAGTTKEAKANRSTFTDEIKNVINCSNVGDMFIFTDIKVRGDDGKTKTLETPIGVEIK